MDRYIPKRIFFEELALEYDLGQALYAKFKEEGREIKFIPSHNRVTGIPGDTRQQQYREAKDTLVVGVRKGTNFQTCKPSAHYQLPLVTSCPGMCEYCYLQTTLGKKPYIRVYVNIEEILERTKEYIENAKPELTIFEGAATSDPIPVEYLTRSLEKSIKFFAKEKYAKFRFVTKFTDIEHLLAIEHNKQTTFRYSINSSYVINNFEHGTPKLEERIKAANKVLNAGYPLGFIIGPIFNYDNYQEDYQHMLRELSKNIDQQEISFELITHRFTKKAKNNILELFPNSKLPLDEEQRQRKYGQFGYLKYVYTPSDMEEMKNFFYKKIEELFPKAKILYYV